MSVKELWMQRTRMCLGQNDYTNKTAEIRIFSSALRLHGHQPKWNRVYSNSRQISRNKQVGTGQTSQS